MQLESANSRVVGRREVMAEISPGNYFSFARHPEIDGKRTWSWNFTQPGLPAGLVRQATNHSDHDGTRALLIQSLFVLEVVSKVIDPGMGSFQPCCITFPLTFSDPGAGGP
jgi:hypothetical protein